MFEILCLLFALVILVLTPRWASPDSFLPLIYSCVIVLSALFILLTERKKLFVRFEYKLLAMSVTVAALCLSLIPVLGFVVSTSILLLAIMKVVKTEKFYMYGVALTLWLTLALGIFRGLLRVPLPEGIFL